MEIQNDTSFLDLLFNCLVGLTILFILSFMMIAVQAKKSADIKTKAEFVITMTWPKEFTDDVDLWVRDPIGAICWFRQKSVTLMHLDRDDLGNQNDIVKTESGQVFSFPYNQELTTIRGLIPGEWILNIHMYRKDTDKPVPVIVQIDKLNPIVKTLLHKIIILSYYWQEETVARFNMLTDGSILSWDDLPMRLVEQKLDH